MLSRVRTVAAGRENHGAVRNLITTGAASTLPPLDLSVPAMVTVYQVSGSSAGFGIKLNWLVPNENLPDGFGLMLIPDLTVPVSIGALNTNVSDPPRGTPMLPSTGVDAVS